MTPEISRLIDRLDLSPGDVLGLAREVSENGALLSVDYLTEREWKNLADLLRFLAQPVEPDLFMKRELRRFADGSFRDAA